jgi:GDP-4-dehydro-6-deoxy-D-mannose reductase
LAAQSSVAVSWKNPALTIDVNIKGTLNLLEAIKEADNPPKLLLIGSSDEYGMISPDDLPIKENTPLRPANIYAASKASQGMIGKIYAKAFGLNIVLTRSFNHIGPGQSDTFVVPSFCKQVAEIEAGLIPPVLNVGNLSAKRDFTDVRDVVRAYKLLAEKGKSGETYNVGSGKATSIQELLDTILKLSSSQITIQQDPQKMRPVDMPIFVADTTLLIETTSWKPVYPIEETLFDTIELWRNKIGK